MPAPKGKGGKGVSQRGDWVLSNKRLRIPSANLSRATISRTDHSDSSHQCGDLGRPTIAAGAFPWGRSSQQAAGIKTEENWLMGTCFRCNCSKGMHQECIKTAALLLVRKSSGIEPAS